MARQVGIALVPAGVVFAVALGALFVAEISNGMDWSRWSPPDWIGIGWPIGFPLFAALIALPVFVAALVVVSVVERSRR